jgi:hypothetical protein
MGIDARNGMRKKKHVSELANVNCFAKTYQF